MRSLNATFKTQKNAATNKPLYLYTIVDYNGSDDLTYAGWDADITFNGVSYSKFPIRHENVSENSDGQIDTVKITVGNVNRIIQGYLEAYDLRGKKVEIRTVFSDQLADTDAYTKETFYIDSYTAGQETVEFNLSSKFDVQDVELPQRKFMRNYCQWRFKSTQCGYAGGTTSCAKTKVACKALSNYSRFGGFPSIPQHRIAVG